MPTDRYRPFSHAHLSRDLPLTVKAGSTMLEFREPCLAE